MIAIIVRVSSWLFPVKITILQNMTNQYDCDLGCRVSSCRPVEARFMIVQAIDYDGKVISRTQSSECRCSYRC